MRRKIAAVGFDLGETLITYADTPLNWAGLYAPALSHAAKTCGFVLGADEIASATAVLKRYNTRLTPRRAEVSAEKIFAEILSGWGGVSVSARPDLIEAFFDFFHQRLVAYPETTSVLADLRRRKIPVGLLTDTPYGMPRSFVQRDLDAAGIGSLFDVWLTSVDVGWRKPEPVGFIALARALNVAPDELCFVGNEEKDVVGARAAGALAIVVDWDGQNPNWGQDHTIRDLRELSARVLPPR
jgi:putative hydrolase of the HAD superfamily